MTPLPISKKIYLTPDGLEVSEETPYQGEVLNYPEMIDLEALNAWVASPEGEEIILAASRHPGRIGMLERALHRLPRHEAASTYLGEPDSHEWWNRYRSYTGGEISNIVIGWIEAARRDGVILSYADTLAYAKQLLG